MEEIFLKKYWEEEKITFYLHFKDSLPVRQIQILDKGTFKTSKENPVNGEYRLYDQTLEDLEIEELDAISRDDFEQKWNEQ